MFEFCDVYKAFLNEALFTKEILGLGINQIRKANYATKGIYYEAFVCLSTGLERIGKLCLILDYYINSNGALPNLKYIKKGIGHDLVKLYKKSEEISKIHKINFRFHFDHNEEIYKRILVILSQFAMGDRYSNIDVLSKEIKQSDSMTLWHNNVDSFIYEHYVSDKKKIQIDDNAELINAMVGDLMLVQHISENGKTISNVKTASKMTGVQEAIAPYRQLFVLQIIRYWSELIIGLGHIAQSVNIKELEIPYFSEVFGGFCNNDSYFKSRKTWDKI